MSGVYRLFGSTGYCSACKKIIPAFEMVMRARTNVYHLECFACQECGHRCCALQPHTCADVFNQHTNKNNLQCTRFCVGDQFFLYDNKVLCGADYEERMVFANLSSNPAQLAQIKHENLARNERFHPFHNNNNTISNSFKECKPPLAPLPPISSVRSSFITSPE